MSKTRDISARSTETFPFYRFAGTHQEIGQQYGETCKTLIDHHLNLVKERLAKSYHASFEDVTNHALKYKPYIEKYAPFLAEEISGMAEGANISIGEAYLLQVRAELNTYFKNLNECTTFAVNSNGTKDHSPIIGQNADLPAFYKEIGVVIEFVPNEGPAHLMLTPAGQISYIGINDQGLGVFANYITCDDWREGFPRYMFSRTVLNASSVQEAEEIISNTYRGSSRNLIMMDKEDGMIDLEVTPTKIGRVEANNGILAHSNHFLSESLLADEKSKGASLKNSHLRLERMTTLLKENYGKLTVEKMQEILRDRENYPNCICQIPGDELHQAPGEKISDVITFASVIAEPSKGHLWIAIGPPDEYEYKLYTFSKSNEK